MTMTVTGIVPLGVSPPTLKTFVKIYGSAEATIAPSPMKKLCIAKPLVRCSSGSISATNARNGSMLIFIDASNIQSIPAAIHREEEFGIIIRAKVESKAPVKKNGRLLPNFPQVLSLR